MFTIDDSRGDVIHLAGKFHAAHTDRAREVLARATGPVILDFRDLTYISSSGLGVLLGIQRKLDEKGEKLKIINPSSHVRELLRISRMDLILDVE